MKWINFLHFYQPPGQDDNLIAGIVKDSYLPIIALLDKYREARMTFNLSGSLIERLENSGFLEVIAGFKKLYERGQIEVVGSAMYHPILPLIPATEIEHQIALNTKVLKKHFGANFQPEGFYFSEMAYDRESAEIVAKAGFKWIILDDMTHFAGIRDNKKPDPNLLYEIGNLGLKIIFRNRALSTTFPPEYICKNKEQLGNATVVTAHDAEVYGHRHTDDRGFNDRILSDKEIQTLQISEHLNFLSEKGVPIEKIEPLSGSWETTREEKQKGVPFSLWNDPKNKIHKKMWKLANKTIEIFNNNQNDPHYGGARTFLDKGFASCGWWWASDRKLGHFSPPAWNPTEIEKGVFFLQKAIRSLKHLPAKHRMSMEKDFYALREFVWKEHWIKKSLHERS